MITQLRERLRERESRRFFIIYLSGKMIGLGVALGAAWLIALFLGSPAGAQTTADLPQEDLINATNTMWVLVAAFLVFFMQAGFMMLEAGFARTR